MKFLLLEFMAAQKTCLHLHRAFPYLYAPCSDISPNFHQQGEKLTNTLCVELEKALKHKGSAGSKRQHVHRGGLVRAKRFYGCHSTEELFIKIYFYYPHDVSHAANLLLVDYNLYGMGRVHLSKMKFHNPVPDAFTSKKSIYSAQHGQEVDNLTSADFQI